jgi:hypothetical protein
VKVPTASRASTGLTGLIKDHWQTADKVGVFDKRNTAKYIAVEIMGAWVQGYWTWQSWQNEYGFYMCATTQSGKTECWRAVNKRWGLRRQSRVKQAKDTLEKNGIERIRQSRLPRGKLMIQSSCATQHAEKVGAASCTSCPKNTHFTIIDPKTNTGTCTSKPCPFCKPKACCDKHHKHYVVNTKSLEGVCVRHDDDCTPVCMPKGDAKPGEKRVCTKGCNQMLKVSKDFGSKGPPKTQKESDLFDILVCQSDKRVVCDNGCPTRRKPNGKCQCQTQKWVKGVAICPFSAELWNLGGTCIANNVHKDTPAPNCPPAPKAHYAMITQPGQCRIPKGVEATLCSPLAMTF